MATLSKGYVFGAVETVTNTKLHNLIDLASITGIVNADIAAGAAIDSSKIAFSLTDYVTLAGIQTITGSKTFSSTTVFSTPLADTNLAEIGTANKVNATAFKNLSGTPSGAGTLPVANGGTGQTTAQAAIDALLPAQGTANGKFLTSNGSASSWGTVSTAKKQLIFGYRPIDITNSYSDITGISRATSASTVLVKTNFPITGTLKNFYVYGTTNAAMTVYHNESATSLSVSTLSLNPNIDNTHTVSISAGDFISIYCSDGSVPWLYSIEFDPS